MYIATTRRSYPAQYHLYPLFYPFSYFIMAFDRMAVGESFSTTIMGGNIFEIHI